MKGIIFTKKAILIAVIGAITLLPYSCSNTETEELPDYIIRYGSECGWCAGQEYIDLSGSSLTYTRNIPCGNDKGETVKTRQLTKADWDLITSVLNYDLFLTLDYNQCNICVDGCDEILKIERNGKLHELRYSFSDEVEGMVGLRSVLSDFMEDMRNLNG